MDNTEECNTLMECAIAGYKGCYYCKYLYKHRCLLTPTYKTDDLDYLKALVDLDEEFDAGKVLNSKK